MENLYTNMACSGDPEGLSTLQQELKPGGQKYVALSVLLDRVERVPSDLREAALDFLTAFWAEHANPDRDMPDLYERAVKALSSHGLWGEVQGQQPTERRISFYEKHGWVEVLRQFVPMAMPCLVRILLRSCPGKELARRTAGLLRELEWVPANEGEHAHSLVSLRAFAEAARLGPTGFGAIQRFVQDEAALWYERQRAVEELVGACDVRCIPLLIDALRHPRVGLGFPAIAAAELDRLGWQATNVADQAYYLTASGRCIEAARLGGPSFDPLIEYLGAGIKHGVADGLAELGDRRAIEALYGALEPRGQSLDCQVCRALHRLGDNRGVLRLISEVQSWVRIKDPSQEGSEPGEGYYEALDSHYSPMAQLLFEIGGKRGIQVLTELGERAANRNLRDLARSVLAGKERPDSRS